jgi:hypothetical protein
LRAGSGSETPPASQTEPLRSNRRGDVEDIGADGLEHGLGHAALSLRSRSRLPNSFSPSNRSLRLFICGYQYAHDKDSYHARRVALSCKF